MPVRQFSPSRPADQQRLTDLLEREWRAQTSTAAEPVILEETDARGDLVHVYVVWSDWAHLTREQRGEVIMEAAERVKLRPDVLRITIAMGLTPEEADRFRIPWRA